MGISWNDLSDAAKARIVASGAAGSGVTFSSESEVSEYTEMRRRAPIEAQKRLAPHALEDVMAKGAAATLAAKAGTAGKPAAPVWDDAMRARMRAAGLPSEPMPYVKNASEDYLAQKASQQMVANGANLGGALKRRAAIGDAAHDLELEQMDALRKALADVEPEA